MPSRQKDQEGFVTQALAGDYPPFLENRLTQLTAASFNHSVVFRRCFLEFLGARNVRKITNCKALTQQSIQRKGELGHLDLEIIRGGRTVVLVENKVDAPLKAQQLEFYGKEPRLKTARKIALVRNYFDFSGEAGKWHVLHWRDFYLALTACLYGKRKIPATDAFIIRNFNQYLETANMHAPSVISKADVIDLARMLHGIRYAEENKYRSFCSKGSEFQTAADWFRMMESVFEDSRLLPKLTKSAEKRYRFTPRVEHWDDVGDDGKLTKTYPWIALQWEISFPKPRGKTKTVGLGLFVSHDCKWNIDAYRYVTGSKSIDSKKIMDGRNDVILTTLSTKVLKAWKQWLRKRV